MITIRRMIEEDCAIITNAFKEQGWNKSKELYERYYKEQQENIRIVLVAELNDDFAGYVTLVYKSHYPYFHTNNIAEIMDFNVLIKFRNQGVGTALMNEVERLASLTQDIVGLRIGLTSDYADAAHLYIKRGYNFDKKGLSYNESYCHYNDVVRLDDDLNLGMTKKIGRDQDASKGG